MDQDVDLLRDAQKNRVAVGHKYRCSKCGGAGRVERGGKDRSCYNCDGTGRMSESFKKTATN